MRILLCSVEKYFSWWELFLSQCQRPAEYWSTVAPSSCFQASDGKFVLSRGNQSLWERLCRQVLNCPELIEKPQYSDNAHRLEHNAELIHIVSEWAANKSVADCVRECSDAGLPCAPVWDFKQVYSSSFYREERRMFITVPTPDGATADAMVQPIVFGSHPRRLRFSATIWPTHRQNTPSKAGYPAEHNRRLSPHGCYQIICSIRYR